ncbi:hypothetical protein [Chitinasiproducens palmae]|uniref:Uncharacterized protein n=1 Tax=Chitinasiproducens palmae TaxID=1770053 RepID=A0A1H2PQH2_9BURK|nr:hypothetical protein [Chitinasiproducens palmae]SDV49046.1 hypothetical protein SAMN05216551_10716 [Chitinasiproducens palmae]
MVFLGFVALACYVALSLLSALRMLYVHGHYSHIEFGTRWREYGHWAPRRYRVLRVMQYVALAGIVLMVVGAFLH